MVDRRKNYDLSRFHMAHDRDYEKALSELKAGYKRSHWMWHIFPQVIGLGKSSTAKFYAIADIGEAKAYMDDLILGAHMRELCEALLVLETNEVETVFDWPDDIKLKSSMTLFEKAVPTETIFARVLDKYYEGERDINTLMLLM